MTWETLAAVVASVRFQFAAGPYRDAHHYVQLPNGHWCRTFGPPGDAVWVRGKIWRAVPRSLPL